MRPLRTLRSALFAVNLGALVCFSTAASAQPSAVSEAAGAFASASSLFDQRKVSEAAPLAERAVALREGARGSAAERAELADALYLLGEIRRAQDDVPLALAAHERALALREAALGAEHGKVIESLNGLARVYLDNEDYDVAEAWIARALRAAEKGKSPLMLAAVLRSEGELRRAVGSADDADAAYERSIALFEKELGRDHPLVAEALDYVVELEIDRGDLDRADALAARALAIVEKVYGSRDARVASALSSAGDVAFEKGEVGRARGLYERAVSVAEAAFGQESPLVAEHVAGLAELWVDEGDVKKAEPLLARVVALTEKRVGAAHPDVARPLNNLAALYLDNEEFGKAEPLYRRAVALLDASRDPFGAGSITLTPEASGLDLARALIGLARVLVERDEDTKADALLKRAHAAAVLEVGDDHPLVGELLFSISDVYLEMKDTKAAIAAAKRAAAVQDVTTATFLRCGSERQKLLYMSKVEQGASRLVALHVAAAPDDPDAARLALSAVLRRKGRALDAMRESAAAIRDDATPEQAKVLDELALTGSELASLLLRGPRGEPVEEHKARVKALFAQKAALESKVSRIGSDLLDDARPVTVDDVQAALPEGAALVELITYDPPEVDDAEGGDAAAKAPPPRRYVAYVLQKRSLEWRDLGEAAPIDRAARELREAASNRANDPGPSARALYGKLIKPLRGLIDATPWIYISPDSALSLVPFSALMDESGHYLVERFSFTYLTSGRDLIEIAKAPREEMSPPVIFGAPDFNAAGPSAAGEVKPGEARGAAGAEVRREPAASRRPWEMRGIRFPPLEGTAEEARSLAGLLPNSIVFLGAAATEGELKKARHPGVLHVATHGFFLPSVGGGSSTGASHSDARAPLDAPSALFRRENPLLRSGLALAGANPRKSGADDGILTALEASRLDLAGTKLVVLSACETGLGEASSGEGVFGLRRALTLAGAESELITLWRISDQGTRDFMRMYYEDLARGGGRSEGVRKAQLAMLRDPARSHPYYWAPFLLSGSGASLSGAAVGPPSAPKVPGGARGCGCEVPGDSNGPKGGVTAALGALAAFFSRMRRRASRRT